MSSQQTLVQIIAEQLVAEATQREEKAKRQAEISAINEENKKQKVRSCLLMLPEVLSQHATLELINDYDAEFVIQLPPFGETQTPFAPIRAKFVGLHYQILFMGYKLPRFYNSYENNPPELGFRYEDDWSKSPAFESVIYNALQLGNQYHEAMIAWTLAEPERIAAKAKQEEAQAAQRTATEAEKDKLRAFAVLLNDDPVLKPLFEVFVAVVMERQNAQEQLDGLNWALDEESSRANRRIAETKRLAEQARDEARRAQADAEEAEERARKAEKKLKQVA